VIGDENLLRLCFVALVGVLSIWLYQAQGINPYENIVFGVFVIGFAVRVTIYWARIQQAQNKEDYSKALAGVNKPGLWFLLLIVAYLVFAAPPNLQEKKDGSKTYFCGSTTGFLRGACKARGKLAITPWGCSPLAGLQSCKKLNPKK